MTHSEIVKKLIGDVRPVGETNTDNERYGNLVDMCALVNELVKEIEAVSHDFIDSNEFSVKRAGLFAKDFLKSLSL